MFVFMIQEDVNPRKWPLPQHWCLKYKKYRISLMWKKRVWSYVSYFWLHRSCHCQAGIFLFNIIGTRIWYIKKLKLSFRLSKYFHFEPNFFFISNAGHFGYLLSPAQLINRTLEVRNPYVMNICCIAWTTTMDLQVREGNTKKNTIIELGAYFGIHHFLV